MTIASMLREFLPNVYERYGALNARQYAYRAETAHIIDTSRGKTKPFNYVNHILTELREKGKLPWSAVLDSSRKFEPWAVKGRENAEKEITSEMKWFRGLPTRFDLPLWHYQSSVPVIFTEKEGLVPYFKMITDKHQVSIYAHKGQAGKSHLHEIVFPWMIRLCTKGKTIQILYLGDCDDEGFQIPVTLLHTIARWAGGSPEFDIHDLYPRHPTKVEHEGSVIKFKRIALTPEQIEEMKLSKDDVNPASSIAHKFVDFKCELEAIEPDVLRGMIQQAVNECWDEKAEQKRQTKAEELRKVLKEKVDELTKNWKT